MNAAPSENRLQTQTEGPPVSVIMPCFNAELYVEEAIRSIVEQTFADFEFLIYDDGSTDRSWEIIQAWSMRDRRIRAKRLAHEGLVALLNRGLREARGKYAARMDADDISCPGRLQAQVQYMEQNPQCVAVGGQALLVDRYGEFMQEFRVPLSHGEIDGGHLRGHAGALLIHPAVLMRKAAVMAVGAYRPIYNMAEDLDLWLRMAEAGELANLDLTVLRYRWHLNNVTARRRAKSLGVARLAQKDARNRRQLREGHGQWVVKAILPALEIWWGFQDFILKPARRKMRGLKLSLGKTKAAETGQR